MRLLERPSFFPPSRGKPDHASLFFQNAPGTARYRQPCEVSSSAAAAFATPAVCECSQSPQPRSLFRALRRRSKTMFVAKRHVATAYQARMPVRQQQVRYARYRMVSRRRRGTREKSVMARAARRRQCYSRRGEKRGQREAVEDGVYSGERAKEQRCALRGEEEHGAAAYCRYASPGSCQPRTLRSMAMVLLRVMP